MPRFRNAIRIYSKKDQVNMRNHDCMRDLQRPVIIISACHEGRDTNKASTAEAESLG
ncbi:hypothetical protein Egran_00129 [Elaphomyces granulatus]|uniref:Uncharacterized protein n=1 Tax=Elaphomyces granulatus TaxID=519963 RepID=A0A232M6T0_9EURO|nr:hypothetical protein Egran_00129 [Elaphomyces granulatus]